MANPSDRECTLVTVAVARKENVFVIAEPHKPTQRQVTILFRLDKGRLAGQNDMPFQAAVIANLPGTELNVVGVEGDILTTRQSANGVVRLTGHVDTSVHGPSGRGWIRDAKFVDGHLYAVGMSRQAYVRDENDAWHHFEGAMLPPLGTVAGLNGIDGFSQRELYAAGLNGEIWRYDGKAWAQLASPTNVQLNAVRRIGDFIYIAGSSGVVLRGRHDAFDIVATAEQRDNLYDIEGFTGEVYVASLKKLFRLADGYLEEIDPGLGEITAGALHARDGVMWSAGANHLISTEDGQTWTQAFLS